MATVHMRRTLLRKTPNLVMTVHVHYRSVYLIASISPRVRVTSKDVSRIKNASDNTDHVLVHSATCWWRVNSLANMAQVLAATTGCTLKVNHTYHAHYFSGLVTAEVTEVRSLSARWSCKHSILPHLFIGV